MMLRVSKDTDDFSLELRVGNERIRLTGKKIAGGKSIDSIKKTPCYLIFGAQRTNVFAFLDVASRLGFFAEEWCRYSISRDFTVWTAPKVQCLLINSN
jgi:hypothetical protein